MKLPLSKLSRVELRDAWPHEALDFTKWLSQPDNLEVLGQEVGIDIKLISTEADVGDFSVDILAEEENSNQKIIIENQLELTNHDHLGKIITYASGYDAEIIIWIVGDVRDEHKKAIEWLNEHTDDNISFFLIKIELWRIENSPAAPKFDIISSPNEWAKTLKANIGNRTLTETKQQQFEFWTNFKSFAHDSQPNLRLQSPRPQHWYTISIGTSEAHVSLTINTRENILGCELYIKHNKELFKFLKERSNEIELELRQKADWIDAEKASRILITLNVNKVLDQNESAQYYKWLLEKGMLFQKTFSAYIKYFKKPE